MEEQRPMSMKKNKEQTSHGTGALLIAIFVLTPFNKVRTNQGSFVIAMRPYLV